MWLPPQRVGTAAHPDLEEVSGLAASHLTPGVSWALNDHGGHASVYAVGEGGQDLGSFALLGAMNEDWEDLAVGPCGPTWDACGCLYVLDGGNNDGTRQEFALVRVPEPQLLDGAPPAQTPMVETLPFRYPEGSRDAEALVVHPDTGETFVITRDPDGVSEVYAFPEAPPAVRASGEVAVLDLVSVLDVGDWDLSSDQVTGAGASPRGERVVLRTNGDVVVLAVPQGAPFYQAFSAGPFPVPAPDLGNGEAVTWSLDGQTLTLVGEGASPAVWSVQCSSFAATDGDTGDPLVDCEAPKPCGCGAPGASGGAGILLALAGIARRAGRRSRR